jgi:hypothetical protein
MDEAAPIDHKDELGPYREEVRSEVLKPFGGVSEFVARSEALVGSWDGLFNKGTNWQTPEQAFAYEFRQDGSAIVEAIGFDEPPSTGEWRVNNDGTFTLALWRAAIPEFGVDGPFLDENRYHINRLPDGRYVIWNGDGSLVTLLARNSHSA